MRIDAIGWSGADGGAGSTLRGLEYRSYQDILKTVKADGFNTVRIASSDLNLHAKPSASALQAHKPTLVGKTTLVTQWIAYRQAAVSQQSPEPVAWISLDSGDNDPVRFWSSVITACRTFHAHLGQTALAHLSQASRSPFSSASLETALSFLYA